MGGAALEFRDRRAERTRLDRLVAEVHSGQGQVLVVRGEAGIGKSALLEYLVDQAGGSRVIRASGVESEMELPFAGLHQLCGRMLDLGDRLPRPQRDALAVAFGLESGGPPDRFLVGAATLGLLTEASDRQPLLCVVDDAQWLDHASAQTLTFVGRRLLADRIGLVFAVREPVDGPEWRGFPELPVGGLADHDAESLLAAVVPGRLDERIRRRIVAETRGNPLALLELPRGLTTAELAGGFERPDARPLTNQIEQNFARRVRALPPQTQRLLLTASAEPVGDLPLLLRALTILGVPIDAAAPAEAAGLIELGARVRFRHPLVRSATYRAAAAADRRVVHQALAEATDVDLDRDRRAWHRAHGAAGPDEDVAGELAGSADRAQRRGGVAAAAAFLQRATELTPDPAVRATRALAAAQVTLRAGAFEEALRLLVSAEDGPADPLHRAHVDLLRAQIAFASGHSKDAPRLLLEVARRLEPLDVDLARDTYLDAIAAAMFGGRLAGRFGVAEVARAARSAPAATARRKRDALLDGAARLFSEGYPAAVPPVREAVQAFRDDDGAGQDDLRWMWLASALAVNLWDDENWDALTARHVRIARELGDLTELPLVLNHRVALSLFAGDDAAAASLVAEIRTISDATGVGLAPYGAVTLAAWRGREDEGTALIGATLDDATARGEGGGVVIAHFANAVLMNGLARYDDALASARTATAYPAELGVAGWALPELVEAAARSGRPELAADGFDRLTELAVACDTGWALGALARSRALLVTGAAAEAHYREAVERLAGTRIRMDLARTHLLYGEWLRREGRRQDARTQLRTAYGMFTTAGAGAFAERTRRELAATGEVVDEHTGPASDSLTAQEAHIADLAGAGLTNAEIGARLFLSHHTVEWHLRKVFTKLGITSRQQLRPPATR
ncbi:helix-turn-helix transcriptional regulator [Jiangella aurantiaca]|uniref:Helix-turn-helix transcriptional regulator n=2 Tax=Jiangella aurantiaca TaxID=2530373 RepID=A0A4R5A2L5_9ACTN|nr:helix-turn-helix transcriptional regulator [Jiangella aurantiaca]